MPAACGPGCRRRVVAHILLVLPVLSAGCATTVGATSLPRVRASYNEAVLQSADEQMLMNIVRLRHQHYPMFLQLSSIITQYTFSTDGSASGTYNIGSDNSTAPNGSVGVGAGVAVSERPTVTYEPLQGEEFLRRLATPLSVTQIAKIIQIGWRADVVFKTCVQRINDVYADTSWAPGGSEIARLATLLRELQQDHQLAVFDTEQGPMLSLGRAKETEPTTSPASEVRELLGLAPSAESHALTQMRLKRPPGTIALQGRSVLGAMVYLSNGLALPKQDPRSSVLASSPPLRIQISKQRPEAPYVAVTYRNRWFYIAEDDHESQLAFMLLNFLFMFTATTGGEGPSFVVGGGG